MRRGFGFDLSRRRRRSAAAAHDYAKTVLLAGFNGANGATSGFVDESSYARPLIGDTTASFSTARFKFGTSSLRCASQTACVVANDNANLEIGANPFRADVWVNFNSLPLGTQYRHAFYFIGKGEDLGEFGGLEDNSFEWGLGYSDAGAWFFNWSDSNAFGGWPAGSLGSRQGISSATPAVTLNQWYLVTVCRDANGNLRLFIDGVMKAKTVYTGTIVNTGSRLNMGRLADNRDPYDGWLDEARLIIGNSDEILTSDATFAVPTAAWPRA